MSRYILSEDAGVDLQEIWQWIANKSRPAADRLEADLFKAFEFLAERPLLGHRRRDLGDSALRVWAVRRLYLIIYRPRTENVQIVRILHGARDLVRELAKAEPD